MNIENKTTYILKIKLLFKFVKIIILDVYKQYLLIVRLLLKIESFKWILRLFYTIFLINIKKHIKCSIIL